MKKNFFATLIIAALIVVMSFTLTSCDFFNRGNGSDSNNGSGSSNSGNTADGSDVKSREDMANIVRHISDALFADIGYTPQSSAPSNAAPISDDVFSEDNIDDDACDELFFIALSLSCVDFLANLYENDNYPLTDKSVQVNGTIENLDIMMIFNISIDESNNRAQIIAGQFSSSDSGNGNIYYLDIHYDFKESSLIDYTLYMYLNRMINECFGRKNGHTYLQDLEEGMSSYIQAKSYFEKLLDESDRIVSDADYSTEFLAWYSRTMELVRIYG